MELFSILYLNSSHLTDKNSYILVYNMLFQKFRFVEAFSSKSLTLETKNLVGYNRSTIFCLFHIFQKHFFILVYRSLTIPRKIFNQGPIIISQYLFEKFFYGDCLKNLLIQE